MSIFGEKMKKRIITIRIPRLNINVQGISIVKAQICSYLKLKGRLSCGGVSIRSVCVYVGAHVCVVFWARAVRDTRHSSKNLTRHQRIQRPSPRE